MDRLGKINKITNITIANAIFGTEISARPVAEFVRIQFLIQASKLDEFLRIQLRRGRIALVFAQPQFIFRDET